MLAIILELLTDLSDDWEYTGTVTAETCLFADLGFESLDLVVLVTEIQERYGQGRIPFAEFLAELGQRPQKDLAVAELVAFVCEHTGAPASGRGR